MADTGVRGFLYGVSAINVIIYSWLSFLGGGRQVEKSVIHFSGVPFYWVFVVGSLKTKPDSLTNQRPYPIF